MKKKKYRIYIEIEEFDDDENDNKTLFSFFTDVIYLTKAAAIADAKRLQKEAEKII